MNTRTFRQTTALLVLVAWAGSAAAQKAPGHPKLDNALNAVADAFKQGGPNAATAEARTKGLDTRPNGLIAVVVEPASGDGSSIDADDVAAHGARLDAVSRSFARVLVAPGQLASLAGDPEISLVRVATPAVELGGFGAKVSESVALTGADAAQAAGFNGAGAKVAVVDLGFIGLAAKIAAGELPASTVSVDYSGTGIEAGTSHGVGVAEHVMDMAPAAQLYCVKVGDEVDLQNAADLLVQAGIQIANHSVGWVIASYYDNTGPINAIINDSYANDGKFWAVAAGNDAKRHWRATSWIDTDNDKWFEFSGKIELMDLTTSSSVSYVFLNWDQYGNSLTDLDLYVVDKRGKTVASSVGAQTGTQEPSEALAFTYIPARAPFKIKIKRYAGPTTGLDMTVFSFYNDLKYAVAANSLMDPANASGAFSVAAINQANWNGSMVPEPYSSRGPTNDGRQQPQITAPDGTTSLTYGTRASFGTSFSSPTTAGAAAILLSEDSLRTAQQLTQLLRNSAIDIGAAGWDATYGHGKLRVLTGQPNP
ncbi:MAG: S8 family serine peptidase [Candidatus Hydrogenedentota bacterium]